MVVDFDLRPSTKKLRRFGFAALVVFGAAGGFVAATGRLFGIGFGDAAGDVLLGLLVVAALSGAFSLLWPRANRPLYVLLTMASFPIGFVFSHAVMAILFFAIITPLGLFFRIIGRDPLQRRWDAERDSYWEDSPEPSDTRSYFRQF